MNQLEKKKEDATKQYTAEMDPLNFELAALLERRIEKKTERYISIRSVEAIVLPEFDKALQDKNKPQLFNQTKNLYESIELLKAATGLRNENAARLGELQSALQQQSGVGVDIHAATGAFGADTNRGPKHMDLFYGPSNDE